MLGGDSLRLGQGVGITWASFCPWPGHPYSTGMRAMSERSCPSLPRLLGYQRRGDGRLRVARGGCDPAHRRLPSTALPSRIPTAAIAAKPHPCRPLTSGPACMRAGPAAIPARPDCGRTAPWPGPRIPCHNPTPGLLQQCRPPEHRGPAHRCPSCLAFSAAGSDGA